MPQVTIEAPPGIHHDAQQEITTAIDEAFHIPDVRIWLREYAAGNVAQDGHLGAEPVRPLCYLEAPELHSIDARRTLANKIMTAVTTAYQGLANTDETLILMNRYPLENAGFAGRLKSDNRSLAGVKQ
jgi:hypothetical protein